MKLKFPVIAIRRRGNPHFRHCEGFARGNPHFRHCEGFARGNQVKKITLIFILFFINQSFASVHLNVKAQDDAKTKIVFFGFDDSDPRIKKDVAEIYERIRKNLKTTDLFDIVKNSGKLESVVQNGQKPSDKKIIPLNKTGSQNISDFIEREANPVTSVPVSVPTISVEAIPDFEKYQKAGIGAIVVAQFLRGDDSGLEARVRMWDVLDQKQIFGKFYSVSSDNYKKLANIISDEVFKAISGEKKGHFNSQIVYIAESGNIKKRIKKVVLIDFDGENRRVLTDGRDLTLTPIFSKKMGEIFYLRYYNSKPQIFSFDLRDNRTKRVGGFSGTNFAASVHPSDPNIILLSAIFDGNADIFEMNISKNVAKRLTKNPAIDTTASYSPDAKTIAFISDRDSGQQIYVMDENGSQVRKLSSGSGIYSKPVYSPDGAMIAFTRIKNGQFYIGTMSANGKNERLLTTGYVVEGAKWSPDGRYLIFTKKASEYGKQSVPKLYIIDIATGFEFMVPTEEGEGASDPDWT